MNDVTRKYASLIREQAVVRTILQINAFVLRCKHGIPIVSKTKLTGLCLIPVGNRKKQVCSRRDRGSTQNR